MEKISSDERLSKDDGLRLYQSSDILSLGYLADFAKLARLNTKNEAEKSDYVYWIYNHHLNLTNICEGSCKFCAYRRKSGEDGAFLTSVENAVEHIEKNVNKNIKEIHIVSALNPQCNLEYYVELLKKCKKILPETHIQGFTAVEIDYIANISGLNIAETLIELKKAGLGSLPGGGAEIFSTNIRKNLCPDKITGEKWLDIMKTAHSLGLKSNATMLTGIGESSDDKIDHMVALRETQDITGGFMSFIPLVCHYENTDLTEYETQTGFEILKNYAIARLMLDNIPHIKAFWIQIGINLAQISLFFGVDDLDGTVFEEKITRFAGAKTGQHISENRIESIIKNAGKIPVQRDTVYNTVNI